jgi:hypothetical protein
LRERVAKHDSIVTELSQQLQAAQDDAAAWKKALMEVLSEQREQPAPAATKPAVPQYNPIQVWLAGCWLAGHALRPGALQGVLALLD